MPRNINSTTIAALQSDAFNLASLVQIDFPVPIQITDWGRSISALSTTFVSSAHLLEVGQSAENSEPSVNSMNIVLSGVEQTYVAIFLNDNYIDVRARIWRAVLDSADAIVGAPFIVFDGRITGFAIDDSDESSTVTVEIATHWKDFELSKGRSTNRNSQQYYFPGDKGMDFAGVTVKNLKWGKA